MCQFLLTEVLFRLSSFLFSATYHSLCLTSYSSLIISYTPSLIFHLFLLPLMSDLFTALLCTALLCSVFLPQAIACRQDLEPILENRYPFGALDGKVTSARLLMTAKAYDQKARVRSLNAALDTSSTSTSFTASSLLRASQDIALDEEAEAEILFDESMNTNKHLTSSEDNTEATATTYRNRKTEEIKNHQRTASRPPHALARMGPSNTADGMPPFCWKEFSRNRDKRGKVFSHQGQPDCFDFPWVSMPPALFV